MSKYKAVVFDLDGTLAESKQKVTVEMAQLLGKLAETHLVAIISGGDWPQYLKQLVPILVESKIDLFNFIFCPTCATKMYIHNTAIGWQPLYSLDLNLDERVKIRVALDTALNITGLKPINTWGPQLEDRGTQITWSALGQDAPLNAKREWDGDFAKRKLIKTELDLLLPNHSIRLGGTTSIDITAKDIDKAYGMRQIAKITETAIAEMLFIGDAIFPDGNDYPVVNTGCDYVCTKSLDQTKDVIRGLINF